MLAKLLRTRINFVQSCLRVSHLSMTGKIKRHIVDPCVQWKELRPLEPDALSYWKNRLMMVVVWAVRSSCSHRRLDELAPEPGEGVNCQISHGGYVLRNSGRFGLELD
jgi:hypothetical protein